MYDFFLLIGLPYIALFSFIVVTIYRFNSNRFGFSSLSSQFLETDFLLWGSVPWHIGIIVVLLGHGVALFAPEFLRSLVSNIVVLYIIESLGFAAALFALIGLIHLFIRRIGKLKILAVTSKMDFIILGLFIVQVMLGILTAVLYRWGASWSTETMSPYFLSILSFKPDISYVQGMPFIIKAHIAFAWLIILLVPFSRLVHIFSFPLNYLWRLPQVVIWVSERKKKNGRD